MEPASVMCEECEATCAELWCPQCEVKMCAVCDAALHSFRFLAGHARVRVGEAVGLFDALGDTPIHRSKSESKVVSTSNAATPRKAYTRPPSIVRSFMGSLKGGSRSPPNVPKEGARSVPTSPTTTLHTSNPRIPRALSNETSVGDVNERRLASPPAGGDEDAGLNLDDHALAAADDIVGRTSTFSTSSISSTSESNPNTYRQAFPSESDASDHRPAGGTDSGDTDSSDGATPRVSNQVDDEMCVSRSRSASGAELSKSRPKSKRSPPPSGLRSAGLPKGLRSTSREGIAPSPSEGSPANAQRKRLPCADPPPGLQAVGSFELIRTSGGSLTPPEVSSPRALALPIKTMRSNRGSASEASDDGRSPEASPPDSSRVDAGVGNKQQLHVGERAVSSMLRPQKCRSPVGYGARTPPSQESLVLLPNVVHSQSVERTAPWLEMCAMVQADNCFLATIVMKCGMTDSHPEYSRKQLLSLLLLMDNPFCYLEELLILEVAKLNDVNTFLRHESVSIYMLQMLLVTIPKDSMKNCLRDYVEKSNDLKNSQNFDFSTTNRIVTTIRDSTFNLLDICADIQGFQIISFVVYNALYQGLKSNEDAYFTGEVPVKSMHKKELRWQCKKLAVVSVVLLRCIVPAILSPVQMGILPAPDAEKQKSLLCLSKFLMKLCTSTSFEKGNSMVFLNDILEDGREKVTEVVKKLIIRGQKLYYGADISFESVQPLFSLGMLSRYLNDNRVNVAKKLGTMGKTDEQEANRVIKTLIRKFSQYKKSTSLDLIAKIGASKKVVIQGDEIITMKVALLGV